MELTFSDILQAGVGVIALFILWQFIQFTAKENERRDAAASLERQRQDKSDERFMLLFTSITGKQIEGTTAVTTAVTTAETAVTAQVKKSGQDVIQQVQTSESNVLETFKLMARLNTEAWKPVAAEPPDLEALKPILQAALQAIKEVQNRKESEVATSGELLPAPPPMAEVTLQ